MPVKMLFQPFLHRIAFFFEQQILHLIERFAPIGKKRLYAAAERVTMLITNGKAIFPQFLLQQLHIVPDRHAAHRQLLRNTAEIIALQIKSKDHTHIEQSLRL